MAAKKAKSAAASATPKGARLNVHISEDAHKRLAVHAIYKGKKPGELVEELINIHLRDWKVQANSPASMDRLVSSDPASLVIPAVAN